MARYFSAGSFSVKSCAAIIEDDYDTEFRHGQTSPEGVPAGVKPLTVTHS
jgi:hypothetical protein